MNALLDYLDAFGGRAKGLLGNPQNYLVDLLRQLPDRSSLQGAVKDPDFYKGLLSNAKEVAGGLLTGAVGAPVDIATMMMRPGGYSAPDKNVVGSSNHLAGLLGLDAESTPYKVGSLLPTDPGDAMKYAGLLGQVAWHGSPHKFDKFKLDKIGTGEGAQAYGHGLYFAENPGVAKNYASMSKQHAVAPDSAHIEAAKNFLENGMDPHAGLRSAYKGITPQQAEAAVIEAKGGFAPNLYKVDIVDDAIPKMLDWDKPLSEQPHIVKALESAGLKAKPDWTGAQLYESSVLVPGEYADKAAAAARLRELGIPGIRYLDGASRGKGGTSNFVVFDDELVKILDRK